MEIERKFLLKSLPDNLNTCEAFHMEQAYISTSPVIRIRKRVHSKSGEKDFILTIKSKGLMSREEHELNISPDEYNNLIKKAEGNIIKKTRYLVPCENGLLLELDIFEDMFEGLIMGEIEFPDEGSAKKYTPSEIFSEEVTFDKNYGNSTMSQMSSEEISRLLLLHKK